MPTDTNTPRPDPADVRALIDPADVRTLDRMGRGFMRPVIEYGDGWEVETTRGESFAVPADVHPVPDSFPDGFTVEDESTDEERERELDGEDTGEYSAARLFSGLATYMPEGCSGEVASATVRRGAYWARMSAPGYLDATDWEVHASAQSAADSLIDAHGDDAGEVDE